ncbi:MAG: hypothetical protein A2Y61_06190 [Chloroflexi bacterium RBG_13_60_13]|nr:MAG: hypothetical protein A2Y61_06190 [Chloroflexi bacterium RBG_13_60_13]
MTGNMSGGQRDHLFISYASEDYELAEWLTLKLTAEGYRVWCDKIQLLGGESYPRDIDRAIKERTFRLLALLSRHSIRKPNPLKERTLALNIGKERALDFLMPLNVDGLSPTQLDWMTSDLTFIPFHEGWASGFAQLLKKLDSIDAPQRRGDGRETVCQWFTARDSALEKPERLWTNLLEIRELPSTLLRVSRPGDGFRPWPDAWPHYEQDAAVAWAFEYPADAPIAASARMMQVDWESDRWHGGLRLIDVVTHLVRRHLVRHCLAKGMSISHDGQDVYFPPRLLPGDRLRFTGYDGRKTWVQAVGERTFRLGSGRREKSRYHLSPVFRPMLRAFGSPVVQIQLRVHLTDSQGAPLDPARAIRRRKSICKDWWNHEWLSRLIGVLSWLAEGSESFKIGAGPSGALVLAGTPIRLSAPAGIDESALAPVHVDEEQEIPDHDFEDDGDDGNGWKEHGSGRE